MVNCLGPSFGILSHAQATDDRGYTCTHAHAVTLQVCPLVIFDESEGLKAISGSQK